MCGLLIALFAIEQIVNGFRNGFDHDEPPEPDIQIEPIAQATREEAAHDHPCCR